MSSVNLTTFPRRTYTTTKWQLAELLFANKPQCASLDIAGLRGVVQRIERESGSGDTFNVTLTHGGETFTVFVRAS